MLPRLGELPAVIDEASIFLSDLGHLHDVLLIDFKFNGSKNTIEFELDDIYSNFAGLLEYPGETKACISMNEVECLKINIDCQSRDLLWILKFSTSKIDNSSKSKANIIFSEGVLEFIYQDFFGWTI